MACRLAGAIIWTTDAGILFSGPLGTNFSEIFHIFIHENALETIYPQRIGGHSVQGEMSYLKIVWNMKNIHIKRS